MRNSCRCSGGIQAVSPPPIVPFVSGLNETCSVTVASQAAVEHEIWSVCICRNVKTSAPSEHPGQSAPGVCAGTTFVARTNVTQSSAISSSRGCDSFSLLSVSVFGFCEQEAMTIAVAKTSAAQRAFMRLTLPKNAGADIHRAGIQSSVACSDYFDTSVAFAV